MMYPLSKITHDEQLEKVRHVKLLIWCYDISQLLWQNMSCFYLFDFHLENIYVRIRFNGTMIKDNSCTNFKILRHFPIFYSSSNLDNTIIVFSNIKTTSLIVLFWTILFEWLILINENKPIGMNIKLSKQKTIFLPCIS